MAAAHDETLSTCGDYNLPGGFSLIHQQAWELTGLLNSYYNYVYSRWSCIVYDNNILAEVNCETNNFFFKIWIIAHLDLGDL